MQVVDTQKRKRALPRQIGCLRLLLIPILMALACYGGLWVFARYGGEWATSDQVLLPPGSQLIESTRSDSAFAAYIFKQDIYFHSWTREELRTWFEQSGISFDEDDSQYDEGRIERPENFRLAFYRTSIWLTVSMTQWTDTSWNDLPITSVGLIIYENQSLDEFHKSHFLELPEITENKTAFVIITKWPQGINIWLRRPISR